MQLDYNYYHSHLLFVFSTYYLLLQLLLDQLQGCLCHLHMFCSGSPVEGFM